MTLAYRSHEGEEIAQECIRRYRLKTMAPRPETNA